ncbi:hypothetical protein [Micromonospora sp. NPDC047074]|uniref:hypothetical protein n=1 Tax=Micromonospora sp. NPDC047074 TaxID=3154339 RepID=UPI00340C7C3E
MEIGDVSVTWQEQVEEAYIKSCMTGELKPKPDVNGVGGWWCGRRRSADRGSPADVTQTAVPAVWVVEAFDVGEDLHLEAGRRAVRP